jgi:hypothetical protein
MELQFLPLAFMLLGVLAGEARASPSHDAGYPTPSAINCGPAQPCGTRQETADRTGQALTSGGGASDKSWNGPYLEIENISALRALGASSANYRFVEVAGFYSAGDGGGGTMIYSASCPQPANAGTFIPIPGVVGACYVRQAGLTSPYNVKWFGAYGDGQSHPVCSGEHPSYANLAAARDALGSFVASCTQETDWAAFQATINSAVQYANTSPTWAQTVNQVSIPAGRFHISETVDSRGTFSRADYPGNLCIPVRVAGAGANATIIEWWGAQPATTVRKAMWLLGSCNGEALKSLTLISPRYARSLGGNTPQGISSVRTPYYGVVAVGVSWNDDFNGLTVQRTVVPFSAGIIKSANLSTLAVNGIEFEPSTPSTGFTMNLGADFAQAAIPNTNFLAQVDEVDQGGIAGFNDALLAGTNSTTPADITAMTIKSVENHQGAIQLTVGNSGGYASGERVLVTGTGAPSLDNHQFVITVDDRTHVTLQGSTFSAIAVSAGSAAYILDGSYAAEFGGQALVSIDWQGGTWATGQGADNGVVRFASAGNVNFSAGWTSTVIPANGNASYLTAAWFENVGSVGSSIKAEHAYFVGPIYRGSAFLCSLTVRDSDGEASRLWQDEQGEIKLFRPLNPKGGNIACDLDIEKLDVGRGSGVRTISLTDISGLTDGPTGYFSGISFGNNNKHWHISGLSGVTNIHYGATNEIYYEGMFAPKPNLLPDFAQLAGGSAVACCTRWGAVNLSLPLSSPNDNTNYSTAADNGKNLFNASAGGFRIALGALTVPGATYIAEFKSNLAYMGAVSGLYGSFSAKIIFCSDASLGSTGSCMAPNSGSFYNFSTGDEGFFGVSSTSQNFDQFGATGTWALFREPAVTTPSGYPWMGIVILRTGGAGVMSIGEFADFAIYQGPTPGYFNTNHGEHF